MGIDVRCLSPAAQRQILGKVLAKSKYHNEKAVRIMPNGTRRTFDSQKEARRYDELAAMLLAGKIRDLRLQQTFTLQESYVDASGETVRAITYKADFTYEKRPEFWTGYEDQCPDDKWNFFIEDTKGVRTAAYRIKRKMMLERGYTIKEI